MSNIKRTLYIECEARTINDIIDDAATSKINKLIENIKLALQQENWGSALRALTFKKSITIIREQTRNAISIFAIHFNSGRRIVCSLEIDAQQQYYYFRILRNYHSHDTYETYLNDDNQLVQDHFNKQYIEHAKTTEIVIVSSTAAGTSNPDSTDNNDSPSISPYDPKNITNMNDLLKLLDTAIDTPESINRKLTKIFSNIKENNAISVILGTSINITQIISFLIIDGVYDYIPQFLDWYANCQQNNNNSASAAAINKLSIATKILKSIQKEQYLPIKNMQSMLQWGTKTTIDLSNLTEDTQQELLTSSTSNQIKLQLLYLMKITDLAIIGESLIYDLLSYSLDQKDEQYIQSLLPLLNKENHNLSTTQTQRIRKSSSSLEQVLQQQLCSIFPEEKLELSLINAPTNIEQLILQLTRCNSDTKRKELLQQIKSTTDLFKPLFYNLKDIKHIINLIHIPGIQEYIPDIMRSCKILTKDNKSADIHSLLTRCIELCRNVDEKIIFLYYAFSQHNLHVKDLIKVNEEILQSILYYGATKLINSKEEQCGMQLFLQLAPEYVDMCYTYCFLPSDNIPAIIQIAIKYLEALYETLDITDTAINISKLLYISIMHYYNNQYVEKILKTIGESADISFLAPQEKAMIYTALTARKINISEKDETVLKKLAYHYNLLEQFCRKNSKKITLLEQEQLKIFISRLAELYSASLLKIPIFKQEAILNIRTIWQNIATINPENRYNLLINILRCNEPNDVYKLFNNACFFNTFGPELLCFHTNIMHDENMKDLIKISMQYNRACYYFVEHTIQEGKLKETISNIINIANKLTLEQIISLILKQLTSQNKQYDLLYMILRQCENDITYRTAIYTAINTTIGKAVLDNGQLTKSITSTILHDAIIDKEYAIIKELLSYGINPDIKYTITDHKKFASTVVKTTTQLAQETQDPEIIKLITASIESKATDVQKKSRAKNKRA